MIWRVPLSDSLPGTFAEVIFNINSIYTGGQKVYGWSLQLDKHACNFVHPEPTPPSDLLYILHILLQYHILIIQYEYIYYMGYKSYISYIKCYIYPPRT